MGNGTGNVLGAAPQLELLQDNGGLTETFALPTTSPAYDHANPEGCTDGQSVQLEEDQRGHARHAGSACDIGAFEYEERPLAR